MLVIRPFRLDDLDGLYAISLATGHEGGDATHLYEDGKLPGHIYAAPYALLEPDFALVAQDEQGVAGFAVGSPDTASWFDRLEEEWWPHLRPVYDDPGQVAMPDWSPDQRRAFMIHHPSPTPGWIVDRYPAHMHLNLAPRAQGRRLGYRLFYEWLNLAQRQGVAALHIGSNRANRRAVKFWTRQRFAPLADPAGVDGRTMWMGRISVQPTV